MFMKVGLLDGMKGSNGWDDRERMKERVRMRQKLIAAICILIVAAFLVPFPLRMKDGGTVKYQAVLYSVSDVHRLAPSEADGYEDGIIIEILGLQIYNSVGRN